MKDLITETYLDCIQEDQLQEIDPLIIAGGVTFMALIHDLFVLIRSSIFLKVTLKKDDNLTKKLNKVVETPGKYTVRVLKEKMPNAFTLGGSDLYVTTGLKDLLTERELIAVLIHEVYHSTALHILKGMAFKYPFLFICLGIFYSTLAATGAPALLLSSLAPVYVLIKLLILRIVFTVPDITYNILFSKIQEYNADEHTLKYGYGDDLVSAFKKIQKIESKLKGNKTCEGFCKIMERVDRTISEHPETKKRIENILRKKEAAELALSNNTTKLLGYMKSMFGVQSN
jgi:Zn-dependent protease with chaperone function